MLQLLVWQVIPSLKLNYEMSGFIRQIILLLFSWQLLTVGLVQHHEKVNIQSTESAFMKHIKNIHTHPKSYFGTQFRDNISWVFSWLTSFDYI